MTPFETFLKSLTFNWKIDALMLAKAGVVLFMLIYLVFSLVVVKQIKLMSKTVNGAMESGLLKIAYGLVGLAILVLILSFVML